MAVASASVRELRGECSNPEASESLFVLEDRKAWHSSQQTGCHGIGNEGICELFNIQSRCGHNRKSCLARAGGLWCGAYVISREGLNSKTTGRAGRSRRGRSRKKSGGTFSRLCRRGQGDKKLPVRRRHRLLGESRLVPRDKRSPQRLLSARGGCETSHLAGGEDSAGVDEERIFHNSEVLIKISFHSSTGDKGTNEHC